MTEKPIDQQGKSKIDPSFQGKPTTMSSGIRKFVLTMHVIFSVGWLGAVVAYTALAVAGLVSHDDNQTVKIVYPALKLVGWYVIVPNSLAALLTGLIQSLGTNWGLFRYYWVSVKFLLTFVASIILVNHMSVVSKMANIVTNGIYSGADFETMRIQLLIHAAGGLLILITTTILSVYKPWGKTVYGLRSNRTQIKELSGQSLTTAKSWRIKLSLGILGLVILFFILHLLTGGMSMHH